MVFLKIVLALSGSIMVAACSLSPMEPQPFTTQAKGPGPQGARLNNPGRGGPGVSGQNSRPGGGGAWQSNNRPGPGGGAWQGGKRPGAGGGTWQGGKRPGGGTWQGNNRPGPGGGSLGKPGPRADWGRNRPAVKPNRWGNGNRRWIQRDGRWYWGGAPWVVGTTVVGSDYPYYYDAYGGIPERVVRAFEVLDWNGDGVLELTEYVSGRGVYDRRTLEVEFYNTDRNGDGVLTLIEFAYGPAYGGW